MSIELDEAVREYEEFLGVGPGIRFCDAPFVNMHFGPSGLVFACCFNQTYALGKYPESSLDEIWNGPAVEALRQAIHDHDLSKGCQKCEQQLLARDFNGLYPRKFLDAARKRAELGAVAIPGPAKLELNISNACNLECVMCHGFSSSLIRKRREALPAMPTPYDDAFVDQLTPFLPGVVEAGFAGGEPFLIPIHYRIWDRLAEHSPETLVMVVTNGTIMNERVESIVSRLPFLVNVSVDSIVKETYEAIRPGSSLERVLANSERFAALMREKGLPCVWLCCVMRQNWREIPDFVRHCNDHEIMVVFNQVDRPFGYSLHTLPPAELAEVVCMLDAADPGDGADGVQRFNHEQYRSLLDRLRGFLDPVNRQHGLVTRVDGVLAIDEMTRLSLAALEVPPFVPDAAKRLAGVAMTYAGARIAIDQEVRADEGVAVPPFAEKAVNDLRVQLRGLRSELAEDAFLRIVLESYVRAYVLAWAVPDGHSVRIFDRIAQAVGRVVAHPDRDSLVDALVETSPEVIYTTISTREPGELIDAVRRG